MQVAGRCHHPEVQVAKADSAVREPCGPAHHESGHPTLPEPAGATHNPHVGTGLVLFAQLLAGFHDVGVRLVCHRLDSVLVMVEQGVSLVIINMALVGDP